MLIIGARGFAKELLDVAHQCGETTGLVFYDDVNPDAPSMLFNQWPVLGDTSAAAAYFANTDNRFIVGIGNPLLRKKMEALFSGLGGKATSLISPAAHIGFFDVAIGAGTAVLPGATIANGASLGAGCMLYYQAVVTHDCRLGSFVELSPGAVVLGRCTIGSGTHIGANATVLPDVNVGENVVIAAGAVVTGHVPDNCMVAGVPAQVKKYFNL